MPTENTQSTRDLSVLVDLPTYQGMNDAEIDMVIDYKVEIEVRKRISEGNKTLNIIQMETLLDQNKASSDAAMNVLKSILDRKPQLNSVEVSNE